MLGVLAATALAIPGCPDAVAPRVVASGLGSLESVVVDRRGRLFFGATAHGALMVIERPGAEAKVVADGIASPGGLAVLPDGDIAVGQGTTIPNAVQSVLFPVARLLRVDPETGETTTIADGLAMANGIARDSKGNFYASNDVGTAIERIAPDGQVDRGFAGVFSANGLAIDAAERFLYAAQTFQPAAIARVDLRDPSQVATHYAAPADEMAGGPDGMTIDERDRLFVAVNAAAEVWRVDPDGQACTIASGITSASAVALGHGDSGFSHRNLYTVGFDGVIREIANVRPAPPPSSAPVRVRVRPRRVRAGRRVRFRIRVRQGGAPRGGVVVRFGTRRARTDARGRVVIRRRLPRGRHVVRAGGVRVVVRAHRRS